MVFCLKEVPTQRTREVDQLPPHQRAHACPTAELILSATVPSSLALLETPRLSPNQLAERPVKRCIVMSHDVLGFHHWRV